VSKEVKDEINKFKRLLIDENMTMRGNKVWREGNKVWREGIRCVERSKVYGEREIRCIERGK
jgi:hypothetical protein